MRQLDKRKGMMIIFILIHIVILVIRDVFLVSLPKEIFIVVEAFFFLIASHNEMTEMLCFLFPLLCGLPANYIMLIALVLYFIKTPHIKITQVLAIVVFTLLEVYASLKNQFVNYNELFGYLAHISVFFVIMLDDNNNIRQCIQSYILGTTLCLCIILLFSFRYAPSNWIYLLSKGWFRIGRYRIENGVHISLNANSVSMFSADTIMLSIGLLYTSKRHKYINITCICILVVAAFFALSRTWFIVMTVFFTLLFWFRKKTIKTFIMMFSTLILILGLVLITIQQVPELFEGFTARVAQTDVGNGVGNRRAELVQIYLESFFNHPDAYLFGAGVINTNYRLGIAAGESSHTSLVQLLVDYGVIGFLAFMTLWYISIKGKYKIGKEYNRDNQGIQIATFIGCFLYSLSGQIVNPYYMLFPNLLVTMALALRCEEYMQTKEDQEGVTTLCKANKRYIIH